MPFQSKQPHVL